MVGYHLMDEDHSIKLGVCEPPSRSKGVPWWGLELFYYFFFNFFFLNIGLKKMFEKLKLDTF